MKRLLLFLIFIITSSQQSLAETPTEFIKRWAEDFNRNDPKVISKFYENTKELEMLVSVGIWHHGFDEMFAAYKGDSKVLQYYDSQIRNLHVRTFDNTAIVGFEHLFKYKVLETGDRVQVHIRTTSTLRKIKGKWLIVMEHSSTIQDQPRAVHIENKL